MSTVVQFTVLGDVTDDALSALADAGVDRSVRTTVLEATIRDQSALYGLLERLRDLGVELCEVQVAAHEPADVVIVVRGPEGAQVISVLAGVRTSRDAPAVLLPSGRGAPAARPGATRPE